MAEVTIKARANGPYKVEGPVRVVDADGNEFVLPQGSGIVLCRCGHSQSKPFCDKSHRRGGFVAEVVAPRRAGRRGDDSSPPRRSVYAFAAVFCFVSAFLTMKRSICSCASSSRICFGGDFMR